MFTQIVDNCTGIIENVGFKNSLSVYPNPTNGTLNLRSDKAQQALVYNSLGQLIKALELKVGETKISELIPGNCNLKLT